jgi:hypothetical protein
MRESETAEMTSPDPRKILQALNDGDRAAIAKMALKAAAEDDDGKVPAEKRCKAVTKKGDPCKAKGNYKDGYCFKHAPIDEDRPRCKATKGDGDQCTNWPQEGSEWCPSHDPDLNIIEKANQAKELKKMLSIGLKDMDLSTVNIGTRDGMLELGTILIQDILGGGKTTKGKTGLKYANIIDIMRMSASLFTEEDKRSSAASFEASEEMQNKAREVASSDLAAVEKITLIAGMVGYENVMQYLEIEVEQDADAEKPIAYEDLMEGQTPNLNLVGGEDAPPELFEEDEPVMSDSVIEPRNEMHQEDLSFGEENFTQPDEEYNVDDIEYDVDVINEPPPKPKKKKVKVKAKPKAPKPPTAQELTALYRKKMTGNFKSESELIEELTKAIANGMDPKTFEKVLIRASGLTSSAPIDQLIKKAVEGKK